MVQLLPFFIIGFIAKSLEDIRSTPDDAEIGYDVEVDLEYPTEHHDKFKEFIPCPESLTPKMEWFSEYQKEVGEKNKVIKKDKYKGCDKLVPHLMKHEKYVLHYRNLKFIMGLGVKITKVHRVLAFKQSAWLKPILISILRRGRKQRTSLRRTSLNL